MRKKKYAQKVLDEKQLKYNFSYWFIGNLFNI